jgi:short-subunit dehydrogenase
MAVYYANKAYVLSFSEALHQELRPLGIKVTALCPGPVPTEFQARAGLREERAQSALLSLSAERVARLGYHGFMRGRRVVIAGVGNKIAVFLVRIVPNAVLMPLLHWGTRFAARNS